MPQTDFTTFSITIFAFHSIYIFWFFIFNIYVFSSWFLVFNSRVNYSYSITFMALSIYF